MLRSIPGLLLPRAGPSLSTPCPSRWEPPLVARHLSWVEAPRGKGREKKEVTAVLGGLRAEPLDPDRADWLCCCSSPGVSTPTATSSPARGSPSPALEGAASSSEVGNCVSGKGPPSGPRGCPGTLFSLIVHLSIPTLLSGQVLGWVDNHAPGAQPWPSRSVSPGRRDRPGHGQRL